MTLNPKQVKINYARRLAALLRKKDRTRADETNICDLRRKLKLMDAKGLGASD